MITSLDTQRSSHRSQRSPMAASGVKFRIATATLVALVMLALGGHAIDPSFAQSAPKPAPDSGSAPPTDAKKSPSDAKKSPAYVWWEGESPTATNFPAETWVSAKNFPDTAHLLSGGQWLSVAWKVQSEQDVRTASYDIEVAEPATYQLWARKFWRHGPFSWRFGKGEWTYCGPDVGLEDSVGLMKHVSASWVHCGHIKLAKGKTNFEIRVTGRPGQDVNAAFDCFALTQGMFVTRGKLKPDEVSGKANTGYWPFEPEVDLFGDSPINLRHLNEKVAGEKGFVGRKGDGFVLGSGKPVRFWGVNVGGGVLELSDMSLEYLAKRLARMGVNLVRMHGAIYDTSSSDPSKVDPMRLERIHKFVALLKAEGVYSTLSFHFPIWMNMRPDYGAHGYQATRNKHPFALLYFDPWMQGVHRKWLEALLSTKNPHTGLALGRDPAVATVELINEDSFFFWTFSPENVPEPKLAILEKLYGEWLAKRHGSIEKAETSWGWQAQARDDRKAKRMTLLPAWDMTLQGATEGPKRKRMSDQLRFLAELQRNYYAETIEHCRRKLKAKCLITCSNWHTADARTLEAIEWHTYMAGDAIDRHAYFGGRHEGENAGWNLAVGQTYADRSTMRDPAASPFAASTVKGMPMMVSELGWPNPNRFKAEMPFLCATYGAMQGIDAYHLFAVNMASWETSAAKFQVGSPVTMGQFPAMALAYRRGDVTEADAVVTEHVSMEEQFAYRGTTTSGTPNLDAFRAIDVPKGGQRTGELRGIDPLSFFAGRVVKDYCLSAKDSVVASLDKLVTTDRKRVSTKSGELAWDIEAGVATVDTKRFQGVCGFLRGGEDGSKPTRRVMSNLAVECAAEYACIVAIALDDAPIETATRVLVQAVTEEQTLGWSVESGTIRSLGGYPFGMRNLSDDKHATTIIITRKTPFTRAFAVDVNGTEIANVPLVQGDMGQQSFVWPAAAIHVVLE